jgi:PhnB protein
MEFNRKKEYDMQVSPYLFFKGNCEAAFKFYETALGAKIEAMMPFEGSPAANTVPAESRKQILHAALRIGDQLLMASDAPGDYNAPKGFSVSINLQDPNEAERIFKALSTGGNVTLPIGPTFWAERFGMVVDQYGIPWMINCAQAATKAA